MEKMNTGRKSPVRGPTAKEVNKEIAELKKENFNLKLRIYFYEERVNTRDRDQDVIKYVSTCSR
ncbi:hypothetical protein DPMN_148598 [Dreissena polymorpha]|uniref:Centrosomin N-terminal motif 1 domain-containing protein n=1 Tax=Dreissena polymorpha TaxID=45954 RepID=A0A9D4FA96_DREPO|nr:hypothetical protein DPMN_148598 [Dreissena polymorpha]